MAEPLLNARNVTVGGHVGRNSDPRLMRQVDHVSHNSPHVQRKSETINQALASKTAQLGRPLTLRETKRFVRNYNRLHKP